MLSINGKPYDTLDEVIGIAENKSSLKSFGVKYEQIELINNDFDYHKIQERLKESKVKTNRNTKIKRICSKKEHIT